MATCVPIRSDDIAGLKAFAKGSCIDLTIVGPEAPLAVGIADEFRRNKLRIFGPTRNATRIESSKAFAKELMIRQGIPTAMSQTFDRVGPALEYLKTCRTPVVVKADGLAQGKGVIIAQTVEEARTAVSEMLEQQAFGVAGTRVVIEDFLTGEEASVMAFADGKTIVPMLAAQDHKRVGDGDTGPNTGGMGAYAPAPIVSSDLRDRILHHVLYPAIEGLSRVGSPFYGVLYAGLMIQDGTPFVLEFNARLGDPETQVVLPLLQTDLVDVVEAVIEHRLDQLAVEWSQQAAVCVVLASGGYPGSYKTGVSIAGCPEPSSMQQRVIFHAGTAWENDRLVTAGGRVLGVTGLGPDIDTARTRAYEMIEGITFDGRHYRHDIAAKVVGVSS